MIRDNDDWRYHCEPPPVLPSARDAYRVEGGDIHGIPSFGLHTTRARIDALYRAGWQNDEGEVWRDRQKFDLRCRFECCSAYQPVDVRKYLPSGDCP